MQVCTKLKIWFHLVFHLAINVKRAKTLSKIDASSLSFNLSTRACTHQCKPVDKAQVECKLTVKLALTCNCFKYINIWPLNNMIYASSLCSSDQLSFKFPLNVAIFLAQNAYRLGKCLLTDFCVYQCLQDKFDPMFVLTRQKEIKNSSLLACRWPFDAYLRAADY